MDRYRLGPVRDVRARDERVKQGDLAATVHDARATAAAVTAAEQRVADARAAIARARLAGLAARAHHAALADRHLARLRGVLETAVAEADRAAAVHAGRLDQIDAARGRLARARAEREVIERHFGRWRDTQRRLAERRAD